MAKLYADNSEGKTTINPIVEKFCFENDVKLDAKLVKYDIIGSLAHAAMLHKIKVLSIAEHKTLKNKLIKTYHEFNHNKWEIKTEDEDVHTAIENRLGKPGEKLHTARSRNDQVLTDMRLYCKEQLLETILMAHSLAKIFLSKAKQYEFIPMPGYTHLQRAMPSSFGMWIGSYGEYLYDVIQECRTAYNLLDQSPLGSGAGYGVSLDIDRVFSAKKMGFSKVQNNSIYCQNSRGYIESTVLASLSSILSVCSRLSSDICLYCSQEFNFINLPDAYFTGSSIMPQKKNPDLFELIRAKFITLQTMTSNVKLISHGLNSGYSKDLQEIKEPTLKAFSETKNTLEVLILVMEHVKPKKEILKQSMSHELFAASEAYELVKKGIPFRTAYRTVKKNLHQLNVDLPEEKIKNMKHLGAPGNLQLESIKKIIITSEKEYKSIQRKLLNTWNQLFK